MEDKVKVTTLTEDDRASILRVIPWELHIDGRLADLLLDAAKGKKANLWTIANIIEKIEARDQKIISIVENFLDERHDFMPAAEEAEKDAVNF